MCTENNLPMYGLYHVCIFVYSLTFFLMNMDYWGYIFIPFFFFCLWNFYLKIKALYLKKKNNNLLGTIFFFSIRFPRQYHMKVSLLLLFTGIAVTCRGQTLLSMYWCDAFKKPMGRKYFFKACKLECSVSFVERQISLWCVCKYTTTKHWDLTGLWSEIWCSWICIKTPVWDSKRVTQGGDAHAF